VHHIGTRIEEPATIGAANVSQHFYVDVHNSEESNYDRGEQHIAIDPGFLAEVQTSNDNNILQYMSLPELIPAKKQKRQQPLLDFTQSIILTSKDYTKFGTWLVLPIQHLTSPQNNNVNTNINTSPPS
jgi:hypothetical protein